MTDAELAEIEARLEAATPGPWEAHFAGIYRDKPVVSHKANARGDRLGRFVLWEGDPEQANKDAAFIARARTDVPALVAEVKALRGLLADLSIDSQAAAEAVRARGAAVRVIRDLDERISKCTIGSLAAILECLRDTIRAALGQP